MFDLDLIQSRKTRQWKLLTIKVKCGVTWTVSWSPYVPVLINNFCTFVQPLTLHNNVLTYHSHLAVITVLHIQWPTVHGNSLFCVCVVALACVVRGWACSLWCTVQSRMALFIHAFVVLISSASQKFPAFHFRHIMANVDQVDSISAEWNIFDAHTHLGGAACQYIFHLGCYL